MDGCGWCLCTDPAPRLVIRCRAGVFSLACWPGGSAEHDLRCAFRNDGSAGPGGHRRRVRALREEGPGLVSVRLTVPLQARAGEGGGGTDWSVTGGAGHDGMSLLGFLQYLWERAGLTVAPQGERRRWADCHRVLQDVVSRVAISGGAAGEGCYVVPPFDVSAPDRHRAAFARFIDGLGDREGMSRRRLLLGAVRSWSDTPYGQRLDLRHHPVPVFVSHAVGARLRRGAPSVFARARPTGSEQVVVAAVTRSDAGNLSVVAAAVMLTGCGFVPADSSHEVVMADALYGAGREFYKPLRYDGSEDTLPDFVLTDTDPPTAVEVWGMGEQEQYALRRDRKRQLYRLRRTPLIEWDPGDRLPDLTRR
nr:MULTISPECIES: DUF1173 family protein [unclassified Pseudonocardia]